MFIDFQDEGIVSIRKDLTQKTSDVMEYHIALKNCTGSPRYPRFYYSQMLSINRTLVLAVSPLDIFAVCNRNCLDKHEIWSINYSSIILRFVVHSFDKSTNENLELSAIYLAFRGFLS